MGIKIEKETYQAYLLYNYSPNTAKLYLWAYNKYHKQLLTQEGIKDYLMEKCFSESRNPLYMGFLKSFIRCFNLPVQINKPKKRLPKKEQYYKFIEKTTVDQLIKELPDYYSMMVRLLFETGLRRTELIDTKVSDINLEERYIKGIGKGNKEYRVKFSKISQDLLMDYLLEFDQVYPFHHGRPNKDHARSFYYNLKKEAEELGLTDIRPHRLRHALGHYLSIDKGLPMPLVKTKLRHTHIQSTEIYAVASQEETDEKIEREVFENAK